jgi:hypothetical protein
MPCAWVLSIPARGAYCWRNSSVVCRQRASCSASYGSRAWSPTMRGSCLALVHCARCRHGVQSFRAKRTSHVIPFFGVGVWEPGDTLLAHRPGDDLAIPIHQEVRFVKAGACAGLRTGLIGPMADERDPIRPLANPRQNCRYVFGSLSRPYWLIVTPQHCRRCLFHIESLILPLYGPEEVHPDEFCPSNACFGEIGPYVWVLAPPCIPRLHPLVQPCEMFLVRHCVYLLRLAIGNEANLFQLVHCLILKIKTASRHHSVLMRRWSLAGSQVGESL